MAVPLIGVMILYFPLPSVEVPMFVPFTDTATPGNGLLSLAEVTAPVMTRV